MEEQTAVGWLIEQLHSHSGHIDVLDVASLNGYFVKAKQKEELQHGQTWDAAIRAHDDRGHVHARSIVDFDEYYQETFKKQSK